MALNETNLEKHQIEVKATIDNWHNLSEREQWVALTKLEANAHLFAVKFFHEHKQLARKHKHEHMKFTAQHHQKSQSHMRALGPHLWAVVPLGLGVASLTPLPGVFGLARDVFAQGSTLIGQVTSKLSEIHSTRNNANTAFYDHETKLAEAEDRTAHEASQTAAQQQKALEDLISQRHQTEHSAKTQMVT